MAHRTPLYDLHAAAGATIIEFGGWEMPLQYEGIVAEHHAVRRDAGVFDVSHMGKVMISGPTAWEFLSRLSTNDLPRKPFRARYTHLLDEHGRIIDDVIITCLASDRYFMVCNAGPRERVLTWLERHHETEHLQDVTSEYLCVALQGPKAARVLQLLTSANVEPIKPFGGTFVELLLHKRPGVSRSTDAPPPEAVGWGPGEEGLADHCFLTRTGYTGEDGFELFPTNELGVAMWNAILGAGGDAGVRPIGLGARDTLRLEKGYLLSGTDFDGTRTSLEASCEWLVKWDHEFVGRDALSRQKERGDYDRLVGLLATDRGVPRHGCEISREGRKVGVVTSGTMSPMLKTGIALGYVRPDAAAEGTEVEILVRDRPLRAIVKKPPFI
jgi:aminomethyltransferase